MCENFGVSATDLFDYWHRIVTTCWRATRPMRSSCAFIPGNDFQGALPDEAFDAQDRPLRRLLPEAGVDPAPDRLGQSPFQIRLLRPASTLELPGRAELPASKPRPEELVDRPGLAARAADAPAVRRSRALLEAIDAGMPAARNEALRPGRRAGRELRRGERREPARGIMAGWGLDIPVIDVAIKAPAFPNRQALTFPIDGHLTEAGHAYLAGEAAPAPRKASARRLSRPTLHQRLAEWNTAMASAALE